MNRPLASLGAALLLVAAVAAAWEFLAAQPPWSPFYLGLLQGPIQQFRVGATTMGVIILIASFLTHKLSPQREPRILINAIYLGTLFFMGALAYGAATGMYGTHIIDPTPGASWMITVKCAGFVVLVGSLIDILRRILQHKLRA